MPELTPLDDNRQEHFLNGEDLEPITRREHFYAGRESELPAGHQEPETREEWFIQKYRGGGGDVTVVPLSVTENGTYSEEGKAYSPVSVNVPLPQNAYLLKSVSNLPQPIASFNDGAVAPMMGLKVAIEPVQDLHGYDSPWVGGAGKNKANVSDGSTTRSGNIGEVILPQGTYTYSLYMKRNDGGNCRAIVSIDGNQEVGTDVSGASLTRSTVTFTINETKTVLIGVQFLASYDTIVYERVQVELGSTATSFAPYSNICPISGWTEANITIADDTTSPTTSHVYTIDLDGTRYGGSLALELVNGEWKWHYADTNTTVNLSEIESFSSDAINASGYIRYNCVVNDRAQNFNILCNKIKVSNSIPSASAGEELISGSSTNNRLYFTIDSTRLSGDLSTSAGRNTALKTLLTRDDIQVVYELATPIDLYFDIDDFPTTLLGDNNISADTGNVLEGEYFSKEV